MPEVSKIARSGLWVSAGFATMRLAQLLAQILLARLLSPADFGLWAMVLLAVNFANLFREAALAQVLVHRGCDDRHLVDAVYSLGIHVSIGLALFQALAGGVLVLVFGRPLLWPLTLGMALTFLLSAGAGCHSAIMSRRMQFRQLAICDAGAGLARLVGSLLGAVLTGGVWAFVVGEICFALTDATLKRTLSSYRFTYHFRLDPALLKEVSGYIRGLLSINVASYVNMNADNLLVGRLLGSQALGFYSLAYQLAMLPVLLLSQLNRINFSVLSQQNRQTSLVYVQRLLDLYASLGGPLYAVIYMITPWLVPLVYGPQWQPTVPLLQMLLVVAYVRGIIAILGTALNALGFPGRNAQINWALIPLSLPAFYLGATWNGAMGVAVAGGLVMGGVALVWFWLATCRTAGWRLIDLIQPIAPPTLAIALAMVLAVSLVQLLPVPVAMRAYLQPVGILLIYAMAMALLPTGQWPRKLLARLNPEQE